jgi:tetratricopeptide (TPR) repeat protein
MLKRVNEEFQSGLIALAESRYQEAISAFENVLKLDPQNTLVPAYMQRAKDAQRLVDEEVVDENSPYYNI